MIKLNITSPVIIEECPIKPTENDIRALYALCRTDVPSEIKIGKTSQTVSQLMGTSYCTRYNPQGFTLLRYWEGNNFYSSEKIVHHHSLLRDFRIRHMRTNRLTEWFTTKIENVDTVVNNLATDIISNGEHTNVILIDDCIKRLTNISTDDWQIAPTLEKDHMPYVKHRIENGTATALDKVSYKKSELRHKLIEPYDNTKTSDITDLDLYHTYKLSAEMDNLYCELYETEQDILRRDIRKESEKISQVRINRIQLIKDLCSLISVPNTGDRTTVVTRQKIESIISYLQVAFQQYRLLFRLRGRAPDSYKTAVGMINTIFKRWSDCKLNKRSSANDDRLGNQSYCLNSSPCFDKIFRARLLLVKSERHILNIVGVNIQNIPRNITPVTLRESLIFQQILTLNVIS